MKSAATQIKELETNRLTGGNLLITVPHMDDAVLGLGGLLAGLPDKSGVRLVYCTDGRGSMNADERHRLLNSDDDIGIIRRRETVAALAVLGYREDQITFMDFEEWKLASASCALDDRLAGILDDFKPAAIFVPSRYDKHTDHLALNRSVRRLLNNRTEQNITCFEYFVYWQWKLLPRGDIRQFIRPAHLRQYDIRETAARKLQALNCFVSQTTLFSPGQRKPVLSPELLERFCSQPELFMKAEQGLRESAILTLPPLLIHLLNRLEPLLKNSKEKILSVIANKGTKG